MRIGGVELLDVQVLLVEPEYREAPGDVLVVPQGNPRQAWFARADDVPAGSDEMHHVAEGWQADNAVRIIGKQRFAGAGAHSGDRPIVASLN